MSSTKERVDPRRIDTFCKTGKTFLPWSMDAEATRLVQYWHQSIVSLPEDVLGRMTIHAEGVPEDRPDYGYFRRDDEQSDTDTKKQGDRKHVMHVRPWDQSYPLVPVYRARNVPVPDGFDQWVQRITSFTRCVLERVYMFLGDVDRVQGTLLAPELCDPKALEKHVVRFLAYDPRSTHEELAEEHCDFSLVTLPVYQSHPGLWTRSKEPDAPRVSFTARDGETFMFAGRKMPLSSKGSIPSVNHGVESSPVCMKETRLAMVVFLHGPGEMGPSCPS